MTAVGETRASLRFLGDDLDPEEVTRLLGGAPTGSAVKGDIVKTLRKTGKSVIARTGRWSRCTDIEASGNLERQIRGLFTGLTTDLGVWHDLATRYHGDVFVGLFLKYANEGGGLSPELLQLIAERKLELQLDIYALDVVEPK